VSSLFFYLLSKPEWGKEPPVLPSLVSLLEHLFDVLLGFLALADFLERLGGQDALEALDLESIAGGHQVVVVDELDKRLYLVAPLLPLRRHPPRYLERVPLDADHERVAERVGLIAVIYRLDDDDLLARISPPSDYGNSADLEELHPVLVIKGVMDWRIVGWL